MLSIDAGDHARDDLLKGSSGHRSRSAPLQGRQRTRRDGSGVWETSDSKTPVEPLDPAVDSPYIGLWASPDVFSGKARRLAPALAATDGDTGGRGDAARGLVAHGSDAAASTSRGPLATLTNLHAAEGMRDGSALRSPEGTDVLAASSTREETHT